MTARIEVDPGWSGPTVIGFTIVPNCEEAVKGKNHLSLIITFQNHSDCGKLKQTSD